MRLFLGLKGKGLASAELDEVCSAVTQLQPHQPQDRHMTLGFIGECSAAQANEFIHAMDLFMLDASLSEVCWCASSIDMFPQHKPKAWALTGAMTDSLRDLITKLSGAHMIGDYIDITRFIPHVSLVYANHDVEIKTVFQSDILLNELVLYRSLSQAERRAIENNLPWAKLRYEQMMVWNLQGKTGLP
ncbi:MAG: hypothetical protein JXR16_08320 [Bermanella sp.]